MVFKGAACKFRGWSLDLPRHVCPAVTGGEDTGSPGAVTLVGPAPASWSQPVGSPRGARAGVSSREGVALCSGRGTGAASPRGGCGDAVGAGRARPCPRPGSSPEEGGPQGDSVAAASSWTPDRLRGQSLVKAHTRGNRPTFHSFSLPLPNQQDRASGGAFKSSGNRMVTGSRPPLPGCGAAGHNWPPPPPPGGRPLCLPDAESRAGPRSG